MKPTGSLSSGGVRVRGKAEPILTLSLVLPHLAPCSRETYYTGQGGGKCLRCPALWVERFTFRYHSVLVADPRSSLNPLSYPIAT